MSIDNVGEVRIVVLDKLPIELFKVIKFENIVQSGGEAKFVIAEGLVSVNGEVETRKRRKVVVGDIVTFANESFQISSKA